MPELATCTVNTCQLPLAWRLPCQICRPLSQHPRSHIVHTSTSGSRVARVPAAAPSTYRVQSEDEGTGVTAGRHRVWTRRVAVCRELRPYVTRAGGTLGCHRSHRSGELLPLLPLPSRLPLLAASLRHQATSAALVDRGPLHLTHHALAGSPHIMFMHCITNMHIFPNNRI